MYNDLGFRVGDRLIVLVEAQSTWTPNIAVRALLYYAGTLRRWVKKRGVNLYDGNAVRLPTAEIYVVYTGTNKSVPNKVSLTHDFPGGALSAVDVTVTILRDAEEASSPSTSSSRRRATGCARSTDTAGRRPSERSSTAS